MRSRCLACYVDSLKLDDIVVLNSKVLKEPRSRNFNEHVTEGLVCIKDGRYYRMVVVTKFFFGIESWKPPSSRIIKEEPISKEEYDRLVSEKGGVEDNGQYWRTRDEIKRLEKELKDMIPSCPRCGSRMVQRSGELGLFWGCPFFRDCRGTRDMSTEYIEQKEDILAKIRELEESLLR